MYARLTLQLAAVALSVVMYGSRSRVVSHVTRASRRVASSVASSGRRRYHHGRHRLSKLTDQRFEFEAIMWRLRFQEMGHTSTYV